MEAAKKGIITPEMKTVAQKENMDAAKLMALVGCGQVAIPANIGHHSLSPEGVGTGLKTKTNVNLGVSGDCLNYEAELEKVNLSLKFGVESIMDLSNYGENQHF
jgi:hydroxymethylpyrimidine synthase